MWMSALENSQRGSREDDGAAGVSGKYWLFSENSHQFPHTGWVLQRMHFRLHDATSGATRLHVVPKFTFGLSKFATLYVVYEGEWK